MKKFCDQSSQNFFFSPRYYFPPFVYSDIIGIKDILQQACGRITQGFSRMPLGIVFRQCGAGIVHLLLLNGFQRSVVQIIALHEGDAEAGENDGYQTQGAEHESEKLNGDAMLHSFSPFHFITLPPDHLQVAGLGGIDLDLFTQMADMDGHGTLAAEGSFPPDGFVERLGGVDFSGIGH